MTDDDTIQACPECGETNITHRQRALDDVSTARYRCQLCTATFDEPVVRDRGAPRDSGGSPLTERLAEMDPDELATDGGVVADLEGDRWRLSFQVSNVEHRTEWTADYPTIENLAEQYRRDPHFDAVEIEAREVTDR